MIRVYPSMLPGEPIETHQADGGSLADWLADNVPDFDLSADSHPIVVKQAGCVVPPNEWEKLTVGDNPIDIYIAPQSGAVDAIGSAISSVVSAVGSVVNAAVSLIGDIFGFLLPSVPGVNQARGQNQGSSIYDPNVQANRPKLGGVIPEIAGQHKVYPDLLSSPRRYFIDHRNQALDMLLCVGKGRFDIPSDSIKIGSTPIGNLGNVIDYTIYPPGANVTGHVAHRRWFNAPEVGASTGSSGLRLRGISDRIHDDGLLVAGDTLNFDVPEGWGVDMQLQVNLRQTLTVTDGGIATESTEVVTAVDTSGNTSTVVSGISVVRDSGGNVTDVTSTSGTALSSATSAATTTTIEIDKPLPDVISGDFTGLSVGMRVRIKGSDLDGVYLIATLVGSEMTLSTLGGGLLTDLPTGTHIASIDLAGATYSIDEIIGERDGVRVSRLLPDGSPDTSWSAFPASVSGRVSVEDNADGVWIGPFLACPEGETTTRIEWDVFAPRGLGKIDTDGDIEERSRDVELQYRALGSDAWVPVVQTLTGQSRDQMGWTFVADIPAMTPEVRVRRNSVESDDTQALDRLEWYGLRSELPAATSYPGVTTIALTIQGSDMLAGQSENKINTVVTRLVPRLGTETEEPSRAIADWFRYVARNIGYSDADLDQDELQRLATVWQSRGDTFDFVHDGSSTVYEVMQRTLRAGAAELTINQGLLTPVRDEPRTTFEQMYTTQNMLEPLTRSIESIRPDEIDGIDVEFFSADTWTNETIECRLQGDAGNRPEKIRIEGVTSRTRAWRLGMRERLRLRYRRKTYSFSTELDALNSNYWSYCALADDVPGYTSSGLILDVSASGGIVTVKTSEPLDWQGGETHLIAWRDQDGSLKGPYTATRGTDGYTVVYNGDAPVVDYSQELPHYMFGVSQTFSYPVLIASIEPQGFSAVSVQAVNYDERVYDYDNLEPPA